MDIYNKLAHQLPFWLTHTVAESNLLPVLPNFSIFKNIVIFFLTTCTFIVFNYFRKKLNIFCDIFCFCTKICTSFVSLLSNTNPAKMSYFLGMKGFFFLHHSQCVSMQDRMLTFKLHSSAETLGSNSSLKALSTIQPPRPLH